MSDSGDRRWAATPANPRLHFAEKPDFAIVRGLEKAGYRFEQQTLRSIRKLLSEVCSSAQVSLLLPLAARYLCVYPADHEQRAQMTAEERRWIPSIVEYGCAACDISTFDNRIRALEHCVSEHGSDEQKRALEDSRISTRNRRSRGEAGSVATSPAGTLRRAVPLL